MPSIDSVHPLADVAAALQRFGEASHQGKIMIEMPGALRFRTITAAIEDGLHHRLTLSSSLGEPMAMGTKVHFLTAVRSNADRVEIKHAALTSEVTLPVVEVEG